MATAMAEAMAMAIAVSVDMAMGLPIATTWPTRTLNMLLKGTLKDLARAGHKWGDGSGSGYGARYGWGDVRGCGWGYGWAAADSRRLKVINHEDVEHVA